MTNREHLVDELSDKDLAYIIKGFSAKHTEVFDRAYDAWSNWADRTNMLFISEDNEILSMQVWLSSEYNMRDWGDKYVSKIIKNGTAVN